METKSNHNSFAFLDEPCVAGLDCLRRIIGEYNFAAKLCLTNQDIFVIVGLADPDYSVDQAIYTYLHSDVCPDADRKRERFRSRSIKCCLLVASILIQSNFLVYHDGEGWADHDGWYWPNDSLQFSAFENALLEEVALRRYDDAVDSITGEEPNVYYLNDVVSFCWSSRKRMLHKRYLWQCLPKNMLPSRDLQARKSDTHQPHTAFLSEEEY